MTEKEKQRLEIERKTKEFLAKGGEVKAYSHGDTQVEFKSIREEDKKRYRAALAKNGEKYGPA